MKTNARVIGLIKRQSWKLEFHCYHVLYFNRETDSMMNAEKAFCKGTFKIRGECGGITKTRWWVNPTTALAYNNLQKL